MGRRAIEGHTTGGHSIDPGSLVSLSQWIVQHDPRWWDVPNDLRPERWLSPAPQPKYACFPFGGGSRICIGESSAWTEAILLLATIAQRWTLLPMSVPGLEPRITLRPKGLHMQVAPTARRIRS